MHARGRSALRYCPSHQEWERRPEVLKPSVVPLLAVALGFSLAACGGTSAPSSSAVTQDGTSSPAATQESETPTPSEAAPPCSDEVLTIENCPDLATLLAGPTYGDSVEGFVDDHHLKTIALDGTISFLINSDRVVYSTADIVVGDAAESVAGPTFRITPKILLPTSALQQDDLVEGMKVRVTALVGSYYSFEPTSSFIPERDTRVVLAEASIEGR